MKTYQSMTSLATSPAISSYSLYSNGFVITGPEDSRSQSVNNLNNYAWQQQQLQSADSMPNGRSKRHSYSSDSDSRNRLDLDKALEALQSQQLQLQHENHRTVSAPAPAAPHNVVQQQQQQQCIVQNGGNGGPSAAAGGGEEKRQQQLIKLNVDKHNDYRLVYNVAADDDDNDDALSVENTRL